MTDWFIIALGYLVFGWLLAEICGRFARHGPKPLTFAGAMTILFGWGILLPLATLFAIRKLFK